MTKEREAVARAIYERRNGSGGTPWSKRGWSHREPYLDDGEAAIAAMKPLLMDVTPEMTSAVEAFKAAGGQGYIGMFQAMLNASPLFKEPAK